MKYFLDTEFIERPGSIQLISIGIVDENDRDYYAISKEFNSVVLWRDQWLMDNVVVPILKDNGLPEKDARDWAIGSTELQAMGKLNCQIADDIVDFVGDDPDPQFYGYYADYDWVVFCWLFGRMTQLPRGFPMYCRDLKQMMDERGLDKVWKRKNCPDPQGEHNALVDARWNKSLFEKISLYAK